MLRIFFSILLLLSFQTFAQPPQVAIIIDDIGYRKSDIQSLYLPGNISYAILPHTPYGRALAQQANAKKNDVILHIPMEAENGKKLGPGALTTSMDEVTIHKTLDKAFAEIPFAIGINNHMGSKLTQLYDPMAWTMQFLKERDLIFIDSMTTSKSQAKHIAKSLGVPNLQRHIFLDNQLDHHYIRQQFMLLIKQVKKEKSIVAIAHPHPETVSSLTKLLPLLAQNGIELVSISTLLSARPLTDENSFSDE